jgi:paraquat-inducible protein B
VLATLRDRAARLDTTLNQMDSTLAAARAALDPESPTLIRLQETMKDLSGAAQSLQSLTDYLDRNPGALLRGRPGGTKP